MYVAFLLSNSHLILFVVNPNPNPNPNPTVNRECDTLVSQIPNV